MKLRIMRIKVRIELRKEEEKREKYGERVDLSMRRRFL
jgi:hypothetical protein